MAMQKEKNKMMQSEMIKNISENLGNGIWTPAHFSEKEFSNEVCFYCVVIPKKELKNSLSDFSWDFNKGDGLPCCEHSGKYIKYGNKRNIRPLVFYRTFENTRPSYIEILEEFRLFHNLYFDKLNNKYIKINDDGSEEDIIIIENFNVKIKTSAIKEFLAITNNKLLILFDIKQYSTYSLEKMNILAESNTYKTVNLIYNLSTCNVTNFCDSYKSISRVLGKKVVNGIPKKKCNIYPFNENKKKQYIEFITKIDNNNKAILTSCNREIWGNFYKPVTFKKEVLNKYYSNPNKYTVCDGRIYCGNLWYLPIDNDNIDKVVVLLGDLGKLSYEEQMYWRSFNIPPQGGMSMTCFNRSFMCIATDASTAYLKFKENFNNFNKDWKREYGWDLFVPLEKEDNYHCQILRIPLNDSQNEFDEQVRGLVKILIDSINEKELNKYTKSELKGSINKLEYFLKQKNISGFEKFIEFLKDLQNLRSSAVAHRKGNNYKKIAKVFGIGEKSFKKVFEEILEKSCEFINYLKNSLINV